MDTICVLATHTRTEPQLGQAPIKLRPPSRNRVRRPLTLCRQADLEAQSRSSIIAPSVSSIHAHYEARVLSFYQACTTIVLFAVPHELARCHATFNSFHPVCETRLRCGPLHTSGGRSPAFHIHHGAPESPLRWVGELLSSCRSQPGSAPRTIPGHALDKHIHSLLRPGIG